jgi:hypothetical protein
MKAVRRLLWVAVALVAVAAIAAWTFPAGLAYRLAGDTLFPLRLHDLGGTVWSGHAGHVDLLGYDLGTLDWRLQPLPLLHGESVAQFVLAGPIASGSGSVRRSGAQTEFDDTVLHVPARVAAPALAIPALELLGTLDIRIASVRLLGMRFERAAGTVLWRGAAVAGAAQARLGDLQATFSPAADGGISGVVQDLGGPLEVAGAFHASIGRYDAQARLAARGDVPQVREALQYIGQPQADGSRVLEIRGRLLAPFGS